MSSKLVLTYFNFRGRGELCRLVLAQGGLEYEDKRMSWDEWPKIKPKYEFGQLPMLEVDGVRIFQSLPISSFLARRCGLIGANEVEAARADMMAHFLFVDIFNNWTRAFHEKDKARQATMRAENHQRMEGIVKMLENVHKTNANSDWLVGNNVTWADLALADCLSQENIKFWDPEFDFRKHSALLADHVERVNDLPNVKKYLDRRPKTAK